MLYILKKIEGYFNLSQEKQTYRRSLVFLSEVKKKILFGSIIIQSIVCFENWYSITILFFKKYFNKNLFRLLFTSTSK